MILQSYLTSWGSKRCCREDDQYDGQQPVTDLAVGHSAMPHLPLAGLHLDGGLTRGRDACCRVSW